MLANMFNSYTAIATDGDLCALVYTDEAGSLRVTLDNGRKNILEAIRYADGITAFYVEANNRVYCRCTYTEDAAMRRRLDKIDAFTRRLRHGGNAHLLALAEEALHLL